VRYRQRLGLQLLELRLGDRAAVEQRLGALDLARRAAVGGDGADVLVEVGLRDLHVADPALGHLLALGDQVDQRPEEREHDQGDDPPGLVPAGDVAAEEVAEDDDQQPDPRDPAEEDDHRPQDVEERIVGCEDRHGLAPYRGVAR
jgi:hypothetical protein